MTMFVNNPHPLNTPLLRVVNDALTGNVTLDKLVQELNASELIVVSEFGRTIPVKDVQLLKALLSIIATLLVSSNVTVTNLLQLAISADISNFCESKLTYLSILFSS